MKVVPIALITKSPLRVGGSSVYFDYVSADLPQSKLVLNLEGRSYAIPYIPATSFKGVLRSQVELNERRSAGRWCEPDLQKRVGDLAEMSREAWELLKRLLNEEVDVLSGAGLLKTGKLTDKSQLREVLEAYLDVTGWNAAASCYSTSDLDRCENTSALESPERRELREKWNTFTGRNAICPVCALYGTGGLRSSVRFTNFFPIDPFPVMLDRISHVSIDRRTGAAAESKLFNEEVVFPRQLFLGFALLLRDELETNFLSHLKLLKDKAASMEVTVGARGSAGYGDFELMYGSFDVQLSDSSLLGGLSVSFKSSQLVLKDPDESLNRLRAFYPSYLLNAVEVRGS
ncbi:hypothetical protein HS1genome_1898 [Sulfodiicoccus acidiphilus]|uniref:CRISPR type III-associated protein domain-containing protein n=1 Tax=Sulfodiicoccus acidiphilus TaxID=1670455 RepID=A0A348B5Q7_9CREN|nr:RAMP superfamily CRISPR-associated protein [Sulfodiicoccus acidiphilus]BBD73509.1 hypothetical protein HS1genome_1898 [Sulfodiicoccus acidiphilus]GGT92639.1 hypothetical protein GCM10007116_08010 [Sulfodiicoccus acidiphilus]